MNDRFPRSGPRAPRALIAALLSTLAASLGAPTALAENANEILTRIDDANNPFDDRRFVMHMEIREPDGSTRAAKIRVGERGRGAQRIIFYRDPPDWKGTSVLIQNRNTLYIYLPTYNRVRRVAMHARKQTFMGSDFTLDDSAQLYFAPDYTPVLLSDEVGKVKLALTPREGRDLGYAKIHITAERTTWLAERIEYFDDQGLLKVETRSDIKTVNGRPMQMLIEMTNARTQHSTRVRIEDVQVNTGLRERTFTKRGLIRGRL
jgi:outer membrane lipoprotein-sorting protein